MIIMYGDKFIDSINGFEGVVLRTSEKAILFWINDREIWVPKSVIELIHGESEGVNRHFTVRVKEWWIKMNIKKGS